MKKAMRDQEVEELLKTVKFLETHIAKYNEDCQNMAESLKNSDKTIIDLEDKLTTQSDINTALVQDAILLKNEINLLKLQAAQEKHHFQVKILEKEAVKSKLSEEISRKNNIIEMASEEVSESNRYRFLIRQKLSAIYLTSQIPKKYMKEILDPDSPFPNSLSYFSKIAKVYNENTRLHEENSHLFQKIDSPLQDIGFKELLEDSNGLKYFRNKGNCGKPKCSSNSYYVSSWIPRPIHSALEEFKAKHDSVVASAVIELFYKLNQMWQFRENKRLERLKSKYCTEIAQLQKRVSPDSTNSLKRTARMHTRNSSMGRIRENISGEFKIASEQMIQLITDFLAVTKRNCNIAESDNWLVESQLTILAKFTDKILSII